MSAREFDVAVGAKATYQAIGFNALSVRFDNNTNQWILANDVGVYISPYTIGAVYPLGGTSTAQFSFTAKPGTAQAALITGESATVTYYDYDQPASAGQTTVVRAPSTEWRNPLGVVKNVGIFSTAGPSGTLTDWTYTVPAGRRARIDVAQAVAEISASDLSGAGTAIEAGITFSPLGAGLGVIVDAIIINGTVVGARCDAILAASKELQATDVIKGVRSNPRGAGVTANLGTWAVITEGDA